MVSIGPKIQIQGEDSYRLALRRIINETKELNSEMDLLTSTFDKNTSTLDKTIRSHELYAKQIESSEKQLSKISEGLDKANKKHQDAIAAYDAQAKKVAELENDQKRLVATMESLERAGSKGSATWNGLNQELEKNKTALEEANQGLVKASDEVERSGRVLADWQTTANKAGAELNNLKRGFEDTSLMKAWGGQFEDVGSKMADFGENLTKYVTVPLAGLGTAAITAAADFEDGMAKIYTIAMDSTEPMEKMRSELVQLSNETGFSLDDLAEATYQTVSASVDATEATDFMTHAVKLARAGFTTTTKAVDILTTVMNSYGKETYDVGYLTDLLLKTQNDGKVVIDQLASSIGVIIPLAANYHVGIEQIAAAYATMTKQGVPAERATTFMRALFTELENKSKDVAEVLDKETGKSFAQLMDSGASLADVLEILYNKMDKNSESYQQLFKNVRSGQAAATLAADDFGILNNELDRMQNVTGLTDRALEQMETPALQARRAVNRLKNTAVDLGETLIQDLAPTFEKVVDGVTKFTDGFMGLSGETKSMIANAAMLAAAIAPVTMLMGKGVELVGKLMMGTIPMINIIGTLAGAYAGVGLAVQAVTEAHNNEIAAQWGLNDEMRQSIQNIEDLKTRRSELVLSIEEEKAATEGQLALASELVTQYNSLIDENGQIKTGNEELATIIMGQLAEALGMEVADVQALVEENGKFGESIDATIEKIRQRAEMAAYEKMYTDAIERKIVAETELEKQEGALTEAVKRSKEAHDNTTVAYNNLLKAQQENSQDLGYYEQAWRDAVQAESEAKNAENTLRGEITETKAVLGEAKADVTIYGNKVQQVMEETAEKAKQESKEGADAIKSNAKDAGEGAKNNLTVDTSPMGMYMMTGVANGIAKYQYLAEQAAARAGRATSRALNNSVQVKSPSRVTFETGKYFVEGFANAIDSGISEMEYLGKRLGYAAADGLSVGSYMPEAYGNTYNNKTVTAPISVNLTVNGNVDDPQAFARSVADMLADELHKESEVFA